MSGYPTAPSGSPVALNRLGGESHHRALPIGSTTTSVDRSQLSLKAPVLVPIERSGQPSRPHARRSPPARTLPHRSGGSPRSGAWGTSTPVGISPDRWGTRDPAGTEPDPVRKSRALVNGSHVHAHCRRRPRGTIRWRTTSPRPPSPHPTESAAPDPAADPIASQNSRRIPVSRIAEGDRRSRRPKAVLDSGVRREHPP
jgi:hypothetical protein